MPEWLLSLWVAFEVSKASISLQISSIVTLSRKVIDNAHSSLNLWIFSTLLMQSFSLPNWVLTFIASFHFSILTNFHCTCVFIPFQCRYFIRMKLCLGYTWVFRSTIFYCGYYIRRFISLSESSIFHLQRWRSTKLTNSRENGLTCGMICGMTSRKYVTKSTYLI